MSAVARPLIISPDTLRGGGAPEARTPPGQRRTAKWPVPHHGAVPPLTRASWRLRVWGACERPCTLSWAQLMELPQVDVRCDIHCVTRWSRLGNTFTGVPARVVVALARPRADARFVLQHAASEPDGDFTVNVPLDAFTADDCLLAHAHDGEPLTPEHGFPVRAVVPRLYSWKGAKWITGLEIRATDAPGFWEVNGYHMHGDPWREQRYGW